MRQLEYLSTVLVSPLLADVKLSRERPPLLYQFVCLCVTVDNTRGTRVSGEEEQKAVIHDNSKGNEEKETEMRSSVTTVLILS